MTVEEIEARWKAATPGVWQLDPHVDIGFDIIWGEEIVAEVHNRDNAKAIVRAPTDIAYLLDLVRKLERAHAWFVENTELAGRPSEGGDGRCVCGTEQDWCTEYNVTHNEGCEWVKARRLEL